MKEHPRSNFEQELKVTNLWEMAEAVKEVAKKYAYTDIKPNTKPSDTYLKTRFPICTRLMALAGYRLADLLNNHLK
jgi:hypothetical protein